VDDTPCSDGPRTCSEALLRAFAFLGKRWNAVILATLGIGPAGFSELARAVGGISDSVLSDRLGELGDVGLLERVVRPGPPISVSYALTKTGYALMPVLDDVSRWAQENLPLSEPLPDPAVVDT
jgi:DNA-binding HxlR family transcriptional regulator